MGHPRTIMSDFFPSVSEIHYNEAVARTPDIARFCTGTDWIIPAHRHLFEPRELTLRRQDDSWLVFAEGPLMQIPAALQPLDALWCFSCSLVGPDPQASVEMLETFLSEEKSAAPLVLLGGIPWDSDLHLYLRRTFGGSWGLHPLPGTDCLQASLDGGVEGFLSRRSAKFRAELRRAERKAGGDGVAFDVVNRCDDPHRLYQRILGIERQSWKWQEGESIFQAENMPAFYTELIERAVAGQRLRAVFARRDGRDIGYAFGACFGGSFRGLQMGYHRDCATLAPGNLCQWELIKCLETENLTTYDLGMEIGYKARWAERKLKLVTLLMLRT